MQNPELRPPIPAPDGTHQSPLLSSDRGDWKSAPGIVRDWAYPLTWLVLIVLPLVLLSGVLNDAKRSAGERIYLVIFCCVAWVVHLWHNRNLKSGAGAAWTTQVVLSCFGLSVFPLGTAIYAYLLSQWVKPEVRGWFGRS